MLLVRSWPAAINVCDARVGCGPRDECDEVRGYVARVKTGRQGVLIKSVVSNLGLLVACRWRTCQLAYRVIL